MFSHIHLVLEEHITLIMPLHLSVVAEVTNYIKIGSLHSVLTLLTHFAKCDVCFLCLYQHKHICFFLNSEHNALSSMCFQMSMEENNSSFLHHVCICYKWKLFIAIIYSISFFCKKKCYTCYYLSFKMCLQIKNVLFFFGHRWRGDI